MNFLFMQTRDKNIYFLIFFLSSFYFFFNFYFEILVFENFLHFSWQILDLDILKKYPFLSFLYNHSQPPLFNIIITFVVKIFGDFNLYKILVFVNYFATIISAISCYLISNKILKNEKILSLVIVLIIFISPSFILYPAVPFYTSLTQLFFLLTVLNILSFKETKIEIFFTKLTIYLVTLSLLRSWAIILLIFLLIFFLYLLFFKKLKFNKKYLLINIFIFLIPLIIIFKNKIFFDTSSLSSWSPANLSREWSNSNITDTLKLGPFPHPSKLINLSECNIKIKNPVVNNVYKKSGYPNMNNCLLINHHKNFLNDQKKNFNLSYYMINTFKNLIFYLQFTPEESFMIKNKVSSIESYVEIYNKFFLPNFSINISYVVNFFDSFINENNYKKSKKIYKINFFYIVFIILFFLSLKKNNFLKLKIANIYIILIMILFHLLLHSFTDGNEYYRHSFHTYPLFNILSYIIFLKILIYYYKLLLLKFLKITCV